MSGKNFKSALETADRVVREVFVLKYFERMTPLEIAATLERDVFQIISAEQQIERLRRNYAK